MRGGFGIYRLPSIGFASVGPISRYTETLNAVSTNNNQTPPYYLNDGVPPAVFNVDSAGNPRIPSSLTNPSNNVNMLELRARTPYNETWQFGIQHNFSGNWLAEVDYVGARGVKLPVAIPLNQLPYDQWGSGNRQSLRPYPQYLNVTGLLNNGNSFYNSLQASLSRRWPGGVLMFAYTWAKITDDIDGPTTSSTIQNIYNLKAEHGIASYDVPHRFVASYVYRLPFGAGGRYFTTTPFVRRVVGGWELSGITQFQTGLPLAVTQSNATGGFTNAQRPNEVASPALPDGQRTLTAWFNTSAFIKAPDYTAGNEPRFAFFGPGINNWDASLMRNIMLREKLRMQIRAEFYNAFNHPNFSNPNTALGNINYGKITSDVSPRITELALRFFW